MITMNKTLIFHSLKNIDHIPSLERWFYRDHCREVLAQSPWLTRYVMYRVIPMPTGAEDYGFFNYRVHENWCRDLSERRGTKGLMAMTPEPHSMNVVIANIPAEPTEDFLGSNLNIYGKSFIRWVTMFAYPEGVSEEEGEDWYLNTHVPEVLTQSGLIRFFSHKAPSEYISPIPLPDNVPSFGNFDSLFFKKWNRVSEMWYETSSSWTESIITCPPQYTPPKWAQYNKYPFLEPMKDFASTFILERPDQNMLRNYEGSIY